MRTTEYTKPLWISTNRGIPLQKDAHVNSDLGYIFVMPHLYTE